MDIGGVLGGVDWGNIGQMIGDVFTKKDSEDSANTTTPKEDDKKLTAGFEFGLNMGTILLFGGVIVAYMMTRKK